MSLITEIVEYAIKKKYHVEINESTIKVFKHDGWTTKAAEAFMEGKASETRFLNFVPLKDMVETIEKTF